MSNEHSRKTSFSSIRSLPQTSTSWSSSSDTKSSRSPIRLKDLLNATKIESKEDFPTYDYSFNGEDPYELITQAEVPKLIWCPYCKAEKRTYFIYANNSQTLYTSLAIFLLGGVFGCCLLPYASKSCKDLKTACCNCKHVISEISE
ncbi:hypothetical protein SteCoe_19511 [Stentor coeruleus]|uniref:LITAF domain-containing protein n=1 Tax=Stentor coeruleus TaxID=5963 RepID=A0A1R2BTV6_9CILI|nr:hypothetical protein SteCoe_19511 [Stentor coeruleus]